MKTRTETDDLFHTNMSGARIPHNVNSGPQLTCTTCGMLRCGKDFVYDGVAYEACAYCVSKAGAESRARGFADATTRLTGILADGNDRDLAYLRGVERVLTDTLNSVRQAIGHRETLVRQLSERL